MDYTDRELDQAMATLAELGNSQRFIWCANCAQTRPLCKDINSEQCPDCSMSCMVGGWIVKRDSSTDPGLIMPVSSYVHETSFRLEQSPGIIDAVTSIRRSLWKNVSILLVMVGFAIPLILTLIMIHRLFR